MGVIFFCSEKSCKEVNLSLFAKLCECIQNIAMFRRNDASRILIHIGRRHHTIRLNGSLEEEF